MAIYPYMKFPYINRRNAKIWGQYGSISLRTLSHIPMYPYMKRRKALSDVCDEKKECL